MPARLIQILCACLLLIAAPCARAQDYDIWYVVELAEKRAGWMRQTRTTQGDTITSSTQTKITIRRDQITITVEMQTEFVESTNGNPRSMRFVQQLGALPITIDYVFYDDHISVTTTQNDQSIESTLPLPEGVWLTPAAAEQYLSQRLAAGANKIIVRTIDPSQGPTPVVTTRTELEKTNIEVVGRIVPAIRCTAINSAFPALPSVEYIDEKGIVIRAEADIGGMKFTFMAADRDLALAELEAPELMQSTLVHVNEPIDRPRNTTRATFVLAVPDGSMPDVPQSGPQRSERIDERHVKVTIDTHNVAAADQADVDNSAYLESSAMITASDTLVAQLTERATRSAGDDPSIRAEALRRFVYRHIDEKDLSVGFASAAEVARSRQGDCTEHGVLLAAMLRADGIPSRVASGLIYAEQFVGARDIFGYHMWAQALLEVDGTPTWVDLDAVLPPQIAFDATHIALSYSHLATGRSQNALVTLAPLLGRLSIQVESVE